jgi:hypothetical protein
MTCFWNTLDMSELLAITNADVVPLTTILEALVLSEIKDETKTHIR